MSAVGNEMVRLRACITGRVQGVSYRASTRDQARRLRLTGWVRNRADGSVELEVQGGAESVARLVDWCHRGPAGARVTAVETEARPTEPAETSFVVRY